MDLFWDLAKGGHHSEWVRLVATYASKNPDEFRVASHPDLTETLAERLGSMVFLGGPSREECDKIERCHSSVQARALEVDLMSSVASRVGAKRLILLHYNPYSIAIRHLQMPQGSIRAVVLDPYPILGERAGIGMRIRHRLKCFRKLGIYLYGMCASKIEKFLLLNDPWTAKDLNRKFLFRRVFDSIVDPRNTDIVRNPLIGSERVAGPVLRVGCFGGISVRKGMLETLLGALDLARMPELLPSHIQELHVWIEGQPYERSYTDQIDAVIALLRKESSRRLKVTVNVRYGIVPDQRVINLFKTTDIISVTYRNFHGSSGVLGMAAAFGLPVIACREGLIGRLTREHRLGTVVDASDPSSIASGFVRLAQGTPEYSPQKAFAFAESLDPQRFFEKLVARD